MPGLRSFNLSVNDNWPKLRYTFDFLWYFVNMNILIQNKWKYKPNWIQYTIVLFVSVHCIISFINGNIHGRTITLCMWFVCACPAWYSTRILSATVYCGVQMRSDYHLGSTWTARLYLQTTQGAFLTRGNLQPASLHLIFCISGSNVHRPEFERAVMNGTKK